MTMKKFEYRKYGVHVSMEDSFEETALNQLGKLGWEAYASYVHDGIVTTYLKREIVDDSEKWKDDPHLIEAMERTGIDPR